jgi:hypothetical protein
MPLSSEPKPLHTPGPWRIVHQDDDLFIMPPLGCEDPCVTSLQAKGNGSNASKNIANANLIAAAPTMLDTLEKVRDSLRDMAITLRMMERVISAASCDIIRDNVEKTIALAKGEG